jgi:GT2 family glycosyltransferase
MSAKVGVVLINWNAGEFTLPCVESLLASGIPPWRILVFDNASSDGSPD